MTIRTRLTMAGAAALFCGSAMWGAESPRASPVRAFPASGALRFEIRDDIDHPFFWWPRTLLGYAVRFDAAHVRAGQLSLVNTGSGEPVRFQLSNVREKAGYLEFAVVNFFADLPTAGVRRFDLTAAPAAPKPAAIEFPVRERRDGYGIVLDTGAVKVRIPAGGPTGGKEVPGPLIQAGYGNRWFGSSRIESPKRRVLRLTTSQVDAGPLFISYRIVYEFEGGAKYTATVRAISGMDFVRLSEEMEGFRSDEPISWQLSWTGLHPTHRHAPNHPHQERRNNEPGFGRYTWETIDQANISTQHGFSTGMTPEGEMSFRLGVFQPWASYVSLNYANFWDQRTGDSVGIFIDKPAKWNDGEYAIWSSSNTLQVRYLSKAGEMSWRWPLANGRRSTGVAAYAHQKDIEAMERGERISKPVSHTDGISYNVQMAPLSHTQFLQNRYGTIDLDMVKDWVLEYPDSARRPPVVFERGEATASALEKAVLTSEPFLHIAPHGDRINTGFNPVSTRKIYERYVNDYNQLYPQMTDRQKRRMTAVFLFMGYLWGEEEFMPIRNMLAGHPDFIMDAKTVPALIAFLFPEHPMAREWADEFERLIDLNTRYHTRPEVKEWESRGGRWTENLGTYVWASLRPVLRGNHVLREYLDGRNRFANPQTVQLGDWLVNALSAPFNGEDMSFYGPSGTRAFHDWGLVAPEEGPRRVHPPQGAHSARRMAPRSLWLIGQLLRSYQPLAAEHMMWAARPNDDDSEMFRDRKDPWEIIYKYPENKGTNPHLKSAKYTGYGAVLRAAVDTPRETSLHLQQIDDGPNARWGVAGEGGNGVIYYYAAGKAYSHNAREDVGDRAAQDTDFCTSFGVFKQGKFKSIGRNVLERPMYDLGFAQFAELVPRKDDTYSYPEYLGRSVMMAGADYFVTYDHVFNDAVAHRFSWFTHVRDELPFIQRVRGVRPGSNEMRTALETGSTKGVWYDGQGDSMAIVSHRKDIQAEAAPFGAVVRLDGGVDKVFREPAGIQFEQDGDVFRGTAGLIRKRADGSLELALFHGETVGSGGLSLSVDDTDLGVSARFRDPRETAGLYWSRKGGSIRLSWQAAPAATAFYVDGVKIAWDISENVATVRVPAGRHRWQVTAGLPVPDPPVVLRTENRSGAALVLLSPVAGATEYLVEISKDNGRSWRRVGTSAQARYELTGLENGSKVHVRAIAANRERSSEPGDEYPVYTSSDPPPAPDGLRLETARDTARITWGEVLGASGYRLYRRVRGSGTYSLVYRGPNRQYTDHPTGVRPAFATPGLWANMLYDGPAYSVYEYAVTSVNGNGEGKRSPAVDTDPASWLNWDPAPGEGFRRRYSYVSTTGVGLSHSSIGKEQEIDRYYPR